KVDVSGTAKAMLPYFQQLGICCDEHCIVPVRNIEKQRALGVPETALEGHAWHTYSISNPSTTIEITHNLIGRASYVKGTICAVEFLQRYITSDYVQKGSVFSMLDVLKNQTN
ncbi:MAG: dihydrodipicolinate reductase C-terminal domain-containing protein, partial [Candidatus Woesearchaeota archaeon]